MTLQERVFDAFVSFVLRHRVLVMVAVLAITAGFANVISELPLMTTLRDVLPDDTPNFARYEKARERFGGDETVIIALEGEHFTEAGLERLATLTTALEEHPLVDRATSLANTDWIHGEPGKLRIDSYLDIDPAEARKAALEDPLVKGNLISPDGRLAIVVVLLIPNDGKLFTSEAVAAHVRKHVDRIPGGLPQLEKPGGKRRGIEMAKQLVADEVQGEAQKAGYTLEQIHVGGFPAVFGRLLIESERTIKVLFPFTCLVIGILLFFLLRRVVDVVLPVVCVLPAVIWAVAIGGMVFGRITIITSAAPVMVLVVGMSDVVHLVTQFRHELGRGLERHEAIRVAFREVGAACALTSLTTFIGFGSMVFLPLPHARELGFFAGLGVVCAFALAFVLTPILLSYGAARPANAGARGPLTGVLARVARIIRPRPKLIFGVGMVITVGVLYMASQIQVENSLLKKLPPDHPLQASALVIQEAVGGTGEMELTMKLGPKGIKDPAVLQGLVALKREVEKHPLVGRADSIADVFARMHAIMAPERGALPDTPEMIAQYLLLFEMSGGGDLSAFLDPELGHIRMTMRMPDLTAEQGLEVSSLFESQAKALMPPGVEAHCTGLGLILAGTGPVILETSLQGLGVALLLIGMIMGLLFRSLRVAVLSMIPNLMPVAFGIVLASLILVQVDADAVINLTICLGIAVDDTIHFLSRYRIERRKGLSRDDAVSVTIVEAGHGIIRTSLILFGGFAVLFSSDYVGLQFTGLMVPATLATAVLLDLTMVPAMAQLGLIEPRS